MISPALQRIAHRTAPLDAADERDLLARAQAGDQTARDRIVLAHVRMAVKAAQRFRRYGVPLDDLVQEGILGLAHAVDGFDLAQPVRFSTFATWSLRARLNDVVLRMALPARASTTSKGKALFFQGRSIRFVLERDGTRTRSEVDRAMAAAMGVSVAAVEAMAGLLHGGVELNGPLRDGDGAGDSREVGETMPDPAPGPHEQTQRRLDARRGGDLLRAALSDLPERERAVVAARYLAEDDEGMTLAELGARYGLSKERIRQIEVSGLRRLRAALADRRADLQLMLAPAA